MDEDHQRGLAALTAGTHRSCLGALPTRELGVHAVRATLERAGIAGEEVEEVVLGCVLQAVAAEAPRLAGGAIAGGPDRD
jgi:acetyl-CoA C-acetyltransferase